MIGHYVYVYGTLRPGGSDVHMVPGTLFDLGYYPGIELGDENSQSFVACEKIEVSDVRLAQLDQYEGYRPSDPERSLYLRRPYLDGFIYVYNQSLDGRRVIKGGDWLKYRGEDRGSAAR